jgi:hypothetical protein
MPHEIQLEAVDVVGLADFAKEREFVVPDFRNRPVMNALIPAHPVRSDAVFRVLCVEARDVDRAGVLGSDIKWSNRECGIIGLVQTMRWKTAKTGQDRKERQLPRLSRVSSFDSLRAFG